MVCVFLGTTAYAQNQTPGGENPNQGITPTSTDVRAVQ